MIRVVILKGIIKAGNKHRINNQALVRALKSIDHRDANKTKHLFD